MNYDDHLFSKNHTEHVFGYLGGRVWSQVVACGPKWSRVAPSGRVWPQVVLMKSTNRE